LSWSHNKYLKSSCKMKMKPQDIKNLQEAYSQVYADQELDEGYMPPTQKRADKMMKQSSKLHRTGSERGDFGHPEAEKKHTQASKIAFMSRRMSDKAKERDEESKKSEFNVKEDLYDRILTHSLDEAEGSYGQTPNARQKMGELTNKRRNTPASEYSERGEKTKKVKSAEKHFNRMGNPDAGNRGKKSTKPSAWSGKRSGMTQKDRDEARGGDEYGHIGYDSDWHGGPSAPGGKPKGKKAERQKKTGVSAESFNAYEVVLLYLLDEGFASTEDAADKIILNMSESWFKNIMEREHDEPGEEDDNPQVRAHNRSVAPKYRPRPRRPRMEDDPRYGTPRDRSGKWKY